MNSFRNFFPEIIGVLAGIAVLNLWYLSSVAIDNGVVPKNYDYLISGFTVAAGAFVGAFSAFWLKKYEEQKSETTKQKSALNSALFTLIRQNNAIHCFRREIDEYKTSFSRGLSMPALKPPEYSDLKLDLAGLHFLMDMGKPQLLLNLAVEQERFDQCVSSINIRNDFYVNEVQPALSFHRLNGKSMLVSEFEEKLGERLFQGAINGAENMVSHIQASDESLFNMYEELREAAIDLFQGEKFISWQKV